MLPFSGVVNHVPLSERKGTKPCEQETHRTLILTSAHPPLTRSGLFCVLQLTSVRIASGRETEQKPY